MRKHTYFQILTSLKMVIKKFKNNTSNSLMIDTKKKNLADF